MQQTMSEIIRRRGNNKEVAMQLYRDHSEEYRGLIARYKSLLDDKKRLGIRPLNALNNSLLSEYPTIALLEFELPADAMKYVSEKDDLCLMSEINAIRRYIDSAVRRALLSKIADFQYEVNRFGRPKSKLGFDPNFRTIASRGQTSQRIYDET